MKLYMFWAVPLPIIRSLFTVHSALVHVIQVWRQLSSRTTDAGFYCSFNHYPPGAASSK